MTQLSVQAVIPAERELLKWNTIEAQLSRRLRGQEEMMVFNNDQRAGIEADFKWLAQVSLDFLKGSLFAKAAYRA